MRHSIRGLTLLTACAALLALPTTARAAGPDTATLWAGPTRLEVSALRYGDFTGGLAASRLLVGPNSTSMCIDLSRELPRLNDGTERREFISGCLWNAPTPTYAFAPVRWKGRVTARIPLRRYVSSSSPDGKVRETTMTPIGVAAVDLQWSGTGIVRTQRTVRTYFFTPYVQFSSKRDARVNGTVRIGNETVRVIRGVGSMASGVGA